MRKSQETNVKYPENQRFRKVIKRGDVKRLAEIGGRTVSSVYMIISGRCRATTEFQKELLEFVKEKEALRRQLNEVVGNE